MGFYVAELFGGSKVVSSAVSALGFASSAGGAPAAAGTALPVPRLLELASLPLQAGGVPGDEISCKGSTI